MTSAAVYVRISQDRAGAGLGVKRQQQDCQALAARLGWGVATVYVDNDMSAYSGKPRPEYRRMLADLDAGTVDGVLAWHTDRLHRSPRELEEYVDVCERRKVTTQTVKAGEIDLATPSGRAVARTLGAWARYEVEHKSERTKRAQQQAAEDGRFRGGARPFGYEADGITTRPDEAAELRRLTDAVLAGSSLSSLISDLNDRGIPTTTGKTWSYATLRQMLMRPRNAGLSEHNGEIVGRGQWEAIVSEDVWRAVCAKLRDPSRRKSSTNVRRWLLSGLALCGDCGGTLKSASASNRDGSYRRVYRCGNTSHVARSGELVDEYVSSAVIARLSRPDALDLVAARQPDVDRDALRAELAAVASQREDALDLFRERVLSKSELRDTLARLDEQRERIEAQLVPDDSRHVLAGVLGVQDVRSAWRRLPLDRQRAVIDHLLTVRVRRVGKGNHRNKPESIELAWRTDSD